MRTFNTRADYYACIVESAELILSTDPTDTLCRQVTMNISGGHTYWDDGTMSLFESPANLEEALLALELRTILEIAIKNQFKAVLVQARKHPVKLEIFGLPMDFGILLSTVRKVSKRNAYLAMQMKLEMAKIAKDSDKRALADFIGKHCLPDPTDGEEYCAQM